MSYSPYFYEEILRHHRSEMQRDGLKAQLAAQLKAEQPSRSALARGRLLVARVPRLRRRSTRTAYA